MRVQALREDFAREMTGVDPARLGFVDESGASTSMTRLRGRAPRGQRVSGLVPGGNWKIVTMLGAVRRDAVAVVATIPQATDAPTFLTFIRHGLAPTLKQGDVVVMDNLSAHKPKAVREVIEQVGARLVYLPPYSPDLSPIEPCWSKAKSILRTLAARTAQTVSEAVTTAFAMITPADLHGCFRHCGYPLGTATRGRLAL